MACKSCQMDNQTLFPSELAIHFPGGMKALDEGQLLAFPQLLVCLTCGFTEFSIPEAELRRLAQGVGVKESPER
jgi:hypothetical protein